MTTKLVTTSITTTVRFAALAWLLLAAAVHANEPSRKLTLSVYLDTAGADSVLAGKYDVAIKQLGSHGASFQRDQIAASTNLCVALIMSRQWDQARSTCDEAVNDARFNTADNTLGARQEQQKEMAIAYSNRAVLEYLTDKPQNATRDVERAHSLAPSTEFVSQNWVALNGKPQSVSSPEIASVN